MRKITLKRGKKNFMQLLTLLYVALKCFTKERFDKDLIVTTRVPATIYKNMLASYPLKSFDLEVTTSGTTLWLLTWHHYQYKSNYI